MGERGQHGIAGHSKTALAEHAVEGTPYHLIFAVTGHAGIRRIGPQHLKVGIGDHHAFCRLKHCGGDVQVFNHLLHRHADTVVFVDTGGLKAQAALTGLGGLDKTQQLTDCPVKADAQ